MDTSTQARDKRALDNEGVKGALYYSEPLLSRKDERELFAAYAATREGSPAHAILADKLFMANTRLARDWAHKYWVQAGPKVRQSLDEDDLEQEALCGLWVAIDKYDVTREEKFSTYATFWIRQRIGRLLDDMGHTIRIPVWRLQQERREKKVASEANTGERPVYVPLPRTISLDAPLDPYGDNPEDSTLAARLEDTVAETHEAATLDRLSDHAALYMALGYLDLRERYVIELRFGLSGGNGGDGEHGNDGMTLEAIGALMQVTRERVRQIEARALRVLRTCLRATPEGDVLVSQLLDRRLEIIRHNHAHARRPHTPVGIRPIQPIASTPTARKKATA
ncbi:MAG TPA: sigma-70 family RNA polymerase sigma factor [Ktedonobacterales bacterium]|nr:sigma-70 family RNA polymerase sigma factor [Ktedonobacterales bacterium]